MDKIGGVTALGLTSPERMRVGRWVPKLAGPRSRHSSRAIAKDGEEFGTSFALYDLGYEGRHYYWFYVTITERAFGECQNFDNADFQIENFNDFGTHLNTGVYWLS